MKRIIIVALLAVVILIFFQSGLSDQLTFAAIKENQARFTELYTQHPALVIGAFFLLYVVVTAASLPGAAFMTLIAGALFGLVTGTIVVSFASSIGATLAFLASRYVLRDWVVKSFGDRMKAIDEGVERDGAFFLLSLRLVPIFPFFLVNLLMGLTKIKTFTYYWVSQVGMLLATMVFVNAGTQLARIDSPSGILTPALIGSFVALGLLPWVAKWVMAVLKRRRVYAGFARPNRYDRNLVVIGAGAAGLVSAYIAATVKAKVTLVEAHKMGGDCLNYGCVPSKALIKSARVAADMRHASRYGLSDAAPQLSFRAVLARVRAVIADIEPHDSVERFTGLGVECLAGHATIVDPWTVRIDVADGTTQQLTTRSIVIAAGAAPFVPPIPGLDAVEYLTSDTMWDKLADRDAPPARLAILGGGPIGCELAQAFARLGSQVTLIEMADQLLIREDGDVAEAVAAALTADGVTLLTGHECTAAAPGRLTLRSRSGDTEVAFDDLIVAVGRTARLTGYGLEQLGIDTAKTVTTDAWLATKFPNIYAAGDVAGPYQLTHVASHQAWFATVNALFGSFKRFKADYSVIPATTFTDPEVARVGLNEREAKAAGVAYDVTTYGLDDLDRAIADSAARGFVKVLTVPGKDRILGATIVGAQAGEMLGEFVLAMKKKIGLSAILGTIHAYPTMIEGNKYAAGEWRRARAPQRLLGYVERYHSWRRG